MPTSLRFAFVGAVLTVLVPLTSQAGNDWETVATGAVTVKTRSRPGTSVREVWAEGDLAAPAVQVQEAIRSGDHYASFMPYVKESRLVDNTTRDSNYMVYTRLGLPVIRSRDFVVACHTASALNPDGTGEFRSEWHAVTDKVAPVNDVVRLTVNSGSWQVSAASGGKTHVVYRFIVDPGGMIPPFLADMANQNAIPDTFRAVEKEAKRIASQPSVAAR